MDHRANIQVSDIVTMNPNISSTTNAVLIYHTSTTVPLQDYDVVIIFGGLLLGLQVQSIVAATNKTLIHVPQETVLATCSNSTSAIVPSTFLHTANTLYFPNIAQNVLVVFGGVTALFPGLPFVSQLADGFITSNQMFSLIPALCLWQSISSSSPWPSPRAGHASAVFNNTLYIHGGCSVVLLDVMFGPVLNTVNTGQPVTPLCAVEPLADLWAFSPSTISWTQLQPQPSPVSGWPAPRWLHSMFAFDSQLTVVGGFGLLVNSTYGLLTQPPTGDVWSLSLPGMTWANRSVLPFPQNGVSRLVCVYGVCVLCVCVCVCL